MTAFLMGYLNNLTGAVTANAGTFTAVNERLVEIAAILETMVATNTLLANTVFVQNKELCTLRE